MNQTTAATTTSPGSRSLIRIYRTELRNEVLKNLRMPAYTIGSLAFPLMFYLLFAFMYGSNEIMGTRTAAYMLATMGSFGVVGTALFGYGVSVATERGQGWMIARRASPMPPLAYFTAKTGMALLMSAIIVVMLFSAAALTQGVTMPAGTWLKLFAIMVMGVVPFCALGLTFGYLVGPNAAPILVNIIYMPMGFLSGMWMPLSLLPSFIQSVAPWLPTYHFGQLALLPLGASELSSPWPSVLYLAVFSVVFLGLAVVLWRRDAGKTVG